MAHGRTHFRRGTSNHARKGTNPVVAKQRARSTEKRVVKSLADARKAQEELDARIRAEAGATAHLVAKSCEEQGVPIKVTDPEVVQQVATLLGVSRPPTATQTADPAKQARWPLGGARQMLRDGYRLSQVVRMTGWPQHMLED